MFEIGQKYEIIFCSRNSDGYGEVSEPNWVAVEVDMPNVKMRRFGDQEMVLNVTSPLFLRAMPQKD